MTMRRKRALFPATLTAATLAGAAATADATSFALSGRRWDLSTTNHLDVLGCGAVAGQLIGLVVAGILLLRRPTHAIAGAAWGAAAGAVGVWIPVFCFVGACAAC